MSYRDNLTEYIEGKGISRDMFESLMKFIDSPDEPIELQQIFENLLQLLKQLEIIILSYPQHMTKVYRKEWYGVCQEVLSFLKTDFDLRHTSRKKKIPLWGFYETNPLYVAIWERPQSQSSSDRYYSLLAHCSLAVNNLRMRMAENRHRGLYDEYDRFDSCIKNALLTLRKIAHRNNIIILEILPLDHNVTPQFLLENMHIANDFCAPIALLVKYFLELKKPLNKQDAEDLQERNNKLHLPAEYVEIRPNLDPDQDAIVPAVDLLRLPTLTEQGALSLEEMGCSPGESYSGTEIVIPDITPCEAKNISSSMQKACHVCQIKSHLSMRNQLLPERWETLTMYEISKYLSAVSNLLLKKERSSFLPVNRL